MPSTEACFQGDEYRRLVIELVNGGSLKGGSHVRGLVLPPLEQALIGTSTNIGYMLLAHSNCERFLTGGIGGLKVECFDSQITNLSYFLAATNPAQRLICSSFQAPFLSRVRFSYSSKFSLLLENRTLRERVVAFLSVKN